MSGHLHPQPLLLLHPQRMPPPSVCLVSEQAAAHQAMRAAGLVIHPMQRSLASTQQAEHISTQAALLCAPDSEAQRLKKTPAAMRVVAAYLLVSTPLRSSCRALHTGAGADLRCLQAVLGGNSSPSTSDIEGILSSGTWSSVASRLRAASSKYQGQAPTARGASLHSCRLEADSTASWSLYQPVWCCGVQAVEYMSHYTGVAAITAHQHTTSISMGSLPQQIQLLAPAETCWCSGH